MPIPFLDLKAQYHALKPEIDAAIAQVCENTQFALGPAVEAFEKDFARYCGTQYALGVNSGTSALAMILQAYGIGRGDEVITVPNTFFATVEAILHAGATPVLVDVEEGTALMDVSKLESAITPKTKAIIPVHLFGQTADMDAILAIAARHNVLVIEDACQAHGTLDKKRRAGSLGHAAAFSFYPGKNLGAFGEAGGVTTGDAQVARTVKMLRDHGQPQKYHHDLVGWNERMDGIQGAVLGVKLKALDEWNARRRAIASKYRELLPKAVRTIDERPGVTSNYHLFVIRTAERDLLQQELAQRGIQTGIHYPTPLHLLKPMQAFGWKKGDFPVAEKLAGDILSLPMFPHMTDAQAAEVARAVTEICAAKNLSLARA